MGPFTSAGDSIYVQLAILVRIYTRLGSLDVASTMTINSEPNGTHDTYNLESLTAKYQKESAKRLRADGNSQYVELGVAETDRLANLAKDPWVDHDTLNAQAPSLKDGDDIQFLILGCGFCGILHAVRLIEAGIQPDQIRLVDIAGGFGGTWYWNRYPGLMCDVESSIYLPLLEETGYMPKHKYSYGYEIRRYCNIIAEKWGIADKAVFRTYCRSYDWSDEDFRWKASLIQDRGPNENAIQFDVTAQFVIIGGGVLGHPKTPNVPGVESFSGEMMHTARWDYAVSGGSPDSWTLKGLQGKKVGIVGTGATAVQVVPELARWAGELYVFQRTPSAVDERGQTEICPEDWKQIANKKGWWRERNTNWCGAIAGNDVGEKLINDPWSRSKTYRYLSGGPHEKPYTPEQVPELIAKALALDQPQTERVRRRVDDVVTKDGATAAALKAWYPTWCKRPCFHDEYLPAFNLPHVKLVDTNAQGVDMVTPGGIVAGANEYDLDIIIWSTGYRAPFANRGDPSRMANTVITARGATLTDQWLKNGATTLHGIVTPWMPNLLLSGPAQSSACANFTYLLDIIASQTAYVLTEAISRAKDPSRVTVEATPDAADVWAATLMKHVMWTAPNGVCGPSYFNNEGEMQRASHEEKMKRARASIYPLGVLGYCDVLRRWRDDGSMDGIKVVG